MSTPRNTAGTLETVGECLYRYSSKGIYYARIKTDGKEIPRSLGATDRDLLRNSV